MFNCFSPVFFLSDIKATSLIKKNTTVFYLLTFILGILILLSGYFGILSTLIGARGLSEAHAQYGRETPYQKWCVVFPEKIHIIKRP